MKGGALTTMSYVTENRMVSYADGSGTTASVYNGIGQKVKQGATTQLECQDLSAYCIMTVLAGEDTKKCKLHL